MASQRDITITKLIDRTSAELGNLVKWPDSEGIQNEVEQSLKALRKTFKEDSYPDIFRYMAAVQIAANIFNEVAYRDAKFGNHKKAWIKLAEIFD
jgi:hypothetical protein